MPTFTAKNALDFNSNKTLIYNNKMLQSFGCNLIYNKHK